MTDNPTDGFAWPKWQMGQYEGLGNAFLVKLIEVPPESFEEFEANLSQATDPAACMEDFLGTHVYELNPDNDPLKGEYLKSIAEEISSQLLYSDGLIIGLCPFPLLESKDDSKDVLKVAMLLRNLDGSDGQVSGNGFRCLAHAILRATNQTSAAIDVFTVCGIRHVDVEATQSAGPATDTVTASAGMGPLKLSDLLTAVSDPAIEKEIREEFSKHIPQIFPAEEGLLIDPSAQPRGKYFYRAAYGTIGNPHLVIAVGDVSHALATIAAEPPDSPNHVNESINDLGNALTFGLKRRHHSDGINPYPDGINVEIIAKAGPKHNAPQHNTIEMVVWERGVGITKACGTGAVVAAAQAAKWGLVDAIAPITVCMPGGDAEVILPQASVALPHASAEEPLLIGPSVYVKDVTFDFEIHGFTQ